MPDVKPLTTEEIAGLREREAATIAQGWTLGQQRPIVIPTENAAFLIAAKKYIPRLLDEVERTRALLRRIEWSATVDRYEHDGCPECLGLKPSPHLLITERPGHEPGCELAALLGGEG